MDLTAYIEQVFSNFKGTLLIKKKDTVFRDV